ncbi:SRPBCC domain-containing protein [Streptomyces sp. NPDC052077]|uniref:SRPBCC domain-containing protein n=1 Tax=Streptomyces sp. NPDC052077 TaxID=3154757 RepID=UPI0034414AEE
MEHEVFVPVPAERLRDALADPVRVARAVPGLQQDAGAEPVAGRLKVRVGGHSITYRGSLRVFGRDDGGYAAEGEAVESRGSGTVGLALTLRVRDADGGSVLTVGGTATADGRVTELPADAVASALTRLLERFAANLGRGAAGDADTARDASGGGAARDGSGRAAPDGSGSAGRGASGGPAPTGAGSGGPGGSGAADAAGPDAAGPDAAGPDAAAGPGADAAGSGPRHGPEGGSGGTPEGGPETGSGSGTVADGETGSAPGDDPDAPSGTTSAGSGTGSGSGPATDGETKPPSGDTPAARAGDGSGDGPEDGSGDGPEDGSGDGPEKGSGASPGDGSGPGPDADLDSDSGSGSDTDADSARRPSAFDTEAPPSSPDREDADTADTADTGGAGGAAGATGATGGQDTPDVPVPPAEAAHARRTMIGRSAEEVDHAPPRGRYAPVPAPEAAGAASPLRWAAPAAALAVVSAVVVGRALRKRR